jgi:hypothetical protein
MTNTMIPTTLKIDLFVPYTLMKSRSFRVDGKQQISCPFGQQRIDDNEFGKP